MPLDAFNFQRRVEQSALIIQRKFRKNRSPGTSEEDTVALNVSEETSNLDEEGGNEDDENKEEESSIDGNLLTTAFVAIFGFGMFVYKQLSKCMQDGDDAGGVENLVPDGNMAPGQPPGAPGTGAPQAQGAPQPPP